MTSTTTPTTGNCQNLPIRHIDGTAGDDTLRGTCGVDVINGLGGNDLITDERNYNVLLGGAGDDVLTGSGHLEGGPGDDLIRSVHNSSDTNNVITYFKGDGRDMLINLPLANARGAQGTLSFADIGSHQLWLRRGTNAQGASNDDLHVTRIGTSDGVTIRNWYLQDPARPFVYRVAAIRAADGKQLSHDRVEALVQAMSVFAPPSSDQSTLSADNFTPLMPALAAAWT